MLLCVLHGVPKPLTVKLVMMKMQIILIIGVSVDVIFNKIIIKVIIAGDTCIINLVNRFDLE